MKGEALFRQSHLCQRCWLIVEGAAVLQSVGYDGQLLQITSYGPGELAGVFPSPRKQEAELICDAHTEALEAQTVPLARLAATTPGIALGLAALLARQNEALLARMANRITLSASGRVYSELLALADENGAIKPAPVLAAIALRVNTTRETASRAVAAAERRGLVSRVQGGLLIISRPRLEALIV
ncbi:MAG TPA: Crp/Fnr family transcriptional regulator [Allosphingosinicella sp.]|uniref:Crp/Fnr family transcriptional regulator n=1 Tax=Allosphingosinicella sp. TaxID=2823234 RepID=UPI002F27E7C3